MSILDDMIHKKIIHAKLMNLDSDTVQKKQFSGIRSAEGFIPIILAARKALHKVNPEGNERFHKPETSDIKNIAMYSSVMKQNMKSKLYSVYINRKYGEIK